MLKEITRLEHEIAKIRRQIAKGKIEGKDDTKALDAYQKAKAELDKLKMAYKSNNQGLSKKAINALKDRDLRICVANSMGVELQAVNKSILTGGKSIADNYNAINTLLDKTGMTVKDLRHGY